ncbi:unnamed protein product [Hymenolepis diminuta]|uniref:Cytochrome b561 domain-containing protein n=1 Tax=Hymenolepis diminuta TaxID=6216 RepID=A0A0R3SHQ8_HYMDI|nr:unnamed protein product [Hymenolepis diminuta]
MNLRAYDSLDNPPAVDESKRRALIPLTVIAQVFGLGAVIMCIVWLGYYHGGYDWNNPTLVFNYHPVFLVLGMVFCFGDVAEIA